MDRFDPNRLDLRLLEKSPVTLYWRKEFLYQDIAELKLLGYSVLHFKYETYEQFCRAVGDALRWEEQFGYQPWSGSLDALVDGLRGEPFDSCDECAFVIEDFNLAHKENKRFSEVLIDVLATAAYKYLVHGKRLLTLVQTSNARFGAEDLGARSAWWNDSEWLDSSRGL